MLITGERRGTPVKDCNRYASNRKAKELASYFAKTGTLRPSDEELLKFYEKGLSDAEIAVALGKSKTLVARWRKKFGMPARREIGVEARDD
jgi:transposase-like protein